MSESIGIEDVFESIERVEESVEEGIGWEEGEKLAFRAAFVGKIDRGVKYETKLCEVVDKSFEWS